jgi:Zn finger protein HypA/HybF involved in hydrogenase expression
MEESGTRSIAARIPFVDQKKNMHELALARTIVDQILEVVEREQLGRLSRVVLELGTAAGIEPDALSLGFEVAARHSPVEGAALEIEPVTNGRDVHIRLLEAC